MSEHLKSAASHVFSRGSNPLPLLWSDKIRCKECVVFVWYHTLFRAVVPSQSEIGHFGHINTNIIYKLNMDILVAVLRQVYIIVWSSTAVAVLTREEGEEDTEDQHNDCLVDRSVQYYTPGTEGRKRRPAHRRRRETLVRHNSGI